MSLVNGLAIVVQIAIMLLFPIGLAIFFRLRFGLSWKIFFIAAGFYLLNLLAQSPFTFFLWPSLFAKQPWVLLALTTFTYGVCEETMRYLSFRAGKTMRTHRTANGALMAGVGHGGTEAIIFGLGTLFSILTALFAPQSLKAQGLVASDLLGGPWWVYIAGGASRIFAVTVHIGFAMLIVQAYRSSWLFLPIAIIAHFIVDFSTFGVQSLTHSLLWTMLIFALWAIAALVLIVRVRRNMTNEPVEEQLEIGTQLPATNL